MHATNAVTVKAADVQSLRRTRCSAPVLRFEDDAALARALVELHLTRDRNLAEWTSALAWHGRCTVSWHAADIDDEVASWTGSAAG